MSVSLELDGVGRHGLPGYEKAAAILTDGSRRDLSIVISELDAQFFSGSWWSSLSRFNLAQLPPVLPGARIASCIERPPSFIVASLEAPPVPFATHGAPAGAADTIVATGPVVIRAGIAGIAGCAGQDGNVALGGLCAFLMATAPDGAASTIARSVSLGPVILNPEHPVPSMMELDGVVLHVDGTAVRTALLSSLRTCPAPAGTVVLLVLCSQAPRESGAARLKFGALGGQARQLTLA